MAIARYLLPRHAVGPRSVEAQLLAPLLRLLFRLLLRRAFFLENIISNLCLCTWNSAALFSVSPALLAKKFDFLKASLLSTQWYSYRRRTMETLGVA